MTLRGQFLFVSILLCAATIQLMQADDPTTVAPATTEAPATTAAPATNAPPATQAPAVTTAVPSSQQFACPSKEELHKCQCIASIRQLHCPKEATYLQLSKPYAFSTVIIEKGDNVADLFEEVEAPGSLITETLIVQDFAPGEAVDVDNLETVLSIVTKSLIIEGAVNSVLDVTSLHHNTLESISISNMTLRNVKVSKLSSLKKLELSEVDFGTPLLNFDASSLAQVIIDRVPTLEELNIKATQCLPNGEKIHIYVRENPKLQTFNMDGLNLNATNGCNYHIDFSGSKNLSPDLLISNEALLKGSGKGQLYLVMREVKQNCDACLKKLATDTHKGYIHSVVCANKPVEGKYLIDPATQPTGNDCP